MPFDEPELFLGLHPTVETVTVGEMSAQFHLTFERQIDVTWTDSRVAPLLRSLSGPGIALAAWKPTGDDTALAEEAEQLLRSLIRKRQISWWYGTAEHRLFDIVPLQGNIDPRRPASGDIARYTLSDLATLTYHDDVPTLFHPVVPAVICFCAEGLTLLPALLSHGRPGAKALPPLPLPVATLFAQCGILTDPATVSPGQRDWSAPEWLMHRSTRSDGFLDTMGRLKEQPKLENLPVRRARSGHAIALPAVADSAAQSPFALLMDARRSRRRPTANPLTATELSSVLWRVARYRNDRPDAVPPFALRNVPGGGGLGEIEYYVGINRCQGVERGFYLYDGHDHTLDLVAPAGPQLDRYFDETALRLTIGDQRPDCTILLTSRLSRLAQKYYGFSYRLTLLHVGVAYEALYLAATELGLSACAIGMVDMGNFRALTGHDPFVETSVGEFALSGRPVSQGNLSPPDTIH